MVWPPWSDWFDSFKFEESLWREEKRGLVFFLNEPHFLHGPWRTSSPFFMYFLFPPQLSLLLKILRKQTWMNPCQILYIPPISLIHSWKADLSPSLTQHITFSREYSTFSSSILLFLPGSGGCSVRPLEPFIHWWKHKRKFIDSRTNRNWQVAIDWLTSLHYFKLPLKEAYTPLKVSCNLKRLEFLTV